MISAYDGLIERKIDLSLASITVSGHTEERDKWNRYYASLPLATEEEAAHLLQREVVELISELLPSGGRILEAGCGGGWQSLALAQTGRFEVAVLDFAEHAIEYARRVFAQAGASARFILDDASNEGEPEFDLVFNAGVLEHYTFEQEAALLRGMRSRSRRFVLAMVPNSRCYWYWIWRAHHSARGGWPFGKEVAQADLQAACAAAGLHPLGVRFLADAWTEEFLPSLGGLDDKLRGELVRIHRSPLIPAEQKAYLAATLAAVREHPAVPGWRSTPDVTPDRNDALLAALCDSLAMNVASENRLADFERRLAGQAAQMAHGADVLQSVRTDLETQQQAIEARDVMIADRDRRIKTLNTTIEAAAAEHGRDMRRAEELRGRTAYGLKEYQARLNQEMETLRSQRAWTVMLGVRKAYTLLRREGWRGKLSFLKYALTWPFASRIELDRYEPRFTDMSPYVPEELRQPIEAGATQISTDGAFSLPAGACAQTTYDVVILAIVDFDFRFQRPQQIAAQFAREGRRVFWVSPTRFAPAAGAQPYRVIPLRENIWELHLRGVQPDIYLGSLDGGALASLSAALRCVFADFAIAESCVLVQLPFWRQLGLALREEFGSKLVYDCMDDWETFENMGRFNLEEEKKLAPECDLLLVTAQQLADKYSRENLRPLLVRNGADYDFFRAAQPGGLLGGLPRPVIGYFGAIADWIDLDLVYEAARLRPSYSFVLVGQVFNRDVSKLESLPNVILAGGKNYSEIPAYLAAFDVCIIPFLLNQVTQATDPVKLYEYFTQGKPVVATDMSELRQCADLLYIARGAEDFAAKLDGAAAERDASRRERRIAFAAENTWARRTAAIDAALCPLFPLTSIVVVAYNSAEFILPCLEAIAHNTSYPNYEVVIVDNCSTDGTLDLVRSHAAGDSRVRWSAPGENLGFAGGNNAGVELARGEYIVLLNADTLVTSGWVERLMRHVRRDPTLGLVCPVTNFAGNEARIAVPYSNQPEMEKFALSLAARRAGEELELTVAPLFCALFRRELWERAGPLDATFEIGMFEDDDFSQRVREAGFRVAAAEDCFVHHFGQGSFAKLPSEEYARLFEQNRSRFERKWNTKWTPHKTRPNVKPAYEDRRFQPRDFVRSIAG